MEPGFYEHSRTKLICSHLRTFLNFNVLDLLDYSLAAGFVDKEVEICLCCFVPGELLL